MRMREGGRKWWRKKNTCIIFHSVGFLKTKNLVLNFLHLSLLLHPFLSSFFMFLSFLSHHFLIQKGAFIKDAKKRFLFFFLLLKRQGGSKQRKEWMKSKCSKNMAWNLCPRLFSSIFFSFSSSSSLWKRGKERERREPWSIKRTF